MNICECVVSVHRIDNFILRLQVFNYLELYVTSHPEYIPWASWSTFPLKSVLNDGEFEIRALANCAVFPKCELV